MKEELITKGIAEKIDNYILQMIVKFNSKVKHKSDDIVRYELKACCHCDKQMIVVKINECDEKLEEECYYAGKPVDEVVLAVDFGEFIMYMLESEWQEQWAEISMEEVNPAEQGAEKLKHEHEQEHEQAEQEQEQEQEQAEQSVEHEQEQPEQSVEQSGEEGLK